MIKEGEGNHDNQDCSEHSKPQNSDESHQPSIDEDEDDVESQERERLLNSNDTATPTADQIWRGEEQINHARKLLYFSHLFDQFSEGTWQFCLVLFLAAFSNYESLVLVSTYGLCSGIFVCYFGPQLGRYIDGADRLFTARLFIGFQSSAVLLATTCCYMLLAGQESPDHFSDHMESEDSNNNYGVPTDTKSIFLLVGVHLLGAIAQVLDNGFTVAIERDWIVVMSQYIMFAPGEESKNLQKQKAWLSETNVALKQIDLSCQIIAPAVAGFVVAGWDGGGETHNASDLKSAALFVGCMCGVALVVEYVCSTKVFYMVQTLAIKPISTNNNSSSSNGTSCGLFGLSRGLKVFMSQEVSWAGISLSLLYSNVLTFGAIMTAYLVWRGISLEQIGIWRGVSAAVGLAGTFVYKILSAKIGLVGSGMLSVTVQFCCLSIAYASLFVDNLTISFAMLIVGVCSSRIGLWVFDISVTQLMQLNVADDVRGEVGGVQSSLNSFFFLLSFGLGIILPDPASFHIYASIGYIFVAAAAVCFAVGVYSKRDSLAKA
ncbi:unnamed protein product [Cylindrotheca closterium]|uniref:Solute carrier family 40 member n=1 Tax=Cylindrotheca closterium TaxID=2856 RepID=A0AAD2CG14_9STRA|nr:unnamed protein product [Cylindrotheca closterium]